MLSKVSLSGKLKDVKLAKRLNAPSPSVVTVFGMSSEPLILLQL